ncbi:4-oxalocrotonate tautomerase DmpI [Methanocaldococcus fervens]|uniref:4-oxalocrotonate tautomerase n=1 Tax=Methanocaldococcus fervens (strain DSM 4213 / JCM 15782 / AG86) TaxID=573064 RepID=C7P745_METFA|nr:4-oxalocrotonate tautomerase DmpI [Methanocaldococcus fervens]ACV24377.1 4-oxalocrotonate tautomerase [Methanocaldococcus fervens AG86]
MPTIVIEGPKLNVEKKRELVKKIYEIASDIYGIGHIVILIKENSPENVGINGKLLIDRKK